MCGRLDPYDVTPPEVVAHQRRTITQPVEQLNFPWDVGVFVSQQGKGEGRAGYVMAKRHELGEDVIASGKAGAQRSMRHTVVNVEDAQAAGINGYARGAERETGPGHSAAATQRSTSAGISSDVRPCGRLRKLVAARCRRFIVSNDRERFVDDLKASLPQGHAVVSVFVVCGRELGTKSAKFSEQSPRRYQEDRRAEVHGTAKLVLREDCGSSPRP